MSKHNDDFDAQEAALEAAAHADYLQTRDALGGDAEFMELLEAMATDFPHLSSQDAQEILDLLKDRGVFKPARAATSASGLEVINKFKELCHDIWEMDPSLRNYARFRVLNVPFLDDLYGGMTATEFAAHKGITKAAVCKELKDAEHRLTVRGIKLVPRADQRSTEACANMRQARLKQLK